MDRKIEINLHIKKIKEDIKQYKAYITNEKNKVRARIKSQSFQLFRKFGNKYKCVNCGNTFDANLVCWHCWYKGNRRERAWHCPRCGQWIRYNKCTKCGARKDLEASKFWKLKIKELDSKFRTFKEQKEIEIKRLKELLKRIK